MHLKYTIIGIFILGISLSTYAQGAGTALDFDGTANEYVECGNSGSISIGNEMTIEAWIKVPSAIPDTSRVGNIIGNNPHTHSFNFEVYTDGKLRFFWNAGQVNALSTGIDLRDDTWHHVAVSRDYNTDQIILYIDGELNVVFTAGSNIDIEWPLRIGNDFQSGGLPFTGLIEEVRLWNSARSEQQLRENIHLPLSGTETGLISYWQLNDSTGTQAVDIISGNNGTLVNMNDSDWINSTIPFGSGFSYTQVNPAGTVAFPGIDLSMDYTSLSENTITATRINFGPNLLPNVSDVIMDDQYWVVNCYGNGTFNANLTFTVAEDLTMEDENDPSKIYLYTRSSNSDLDWEYLASASTVDAANNTATFPEITTFSQFIIGRNMGEPFINLVNFYNFISCGEIAFLGEDNPSPSLTDFDGDSLLDLIIGSDNGMLGYYKQDSINSTSFHYITFHWGSIHVVGNSKPTFTDLDGDSLLDLIIGNGLGNLIHYEQPYINSHSFYEVDSTFNNVDVGWDASPTFTDLDGDGFLDLIIGNGFGNLIHYEQDSINATSFCIVDSTFNSINVIQYSSPSFTDLEGDGLLDLIVGGGYYSSILNHYKQDSINATSFSLVDSTFNSINSYRSSPTFTDLDGDGLLDLIVGRQWGCEHYEQEAADSLNFGSVYGGDTSAPQSYFIKANFLKDDLLITCPEGFTVSLTETSGYAQNLSLVPEYGTISAKIYIRFEPASGIPYDGSVANTCLGATTRNITVAGLGVKGDGFPGTALDLDGTDDYVSTNIDVNPGVYQTMTWEAWVYPKRANYEEWQYLFSHDDNGWDRTIAILPNSSFWEVHTGNGHWEPVELDLNTWQHIAVVFDDVNDKLYFYKNGIQNEYNGTTNYGSSLRELNIGRRPEYSYFFQGKIEEARIWETIRTQQEIRENMHIPLIGNEPGLISYWQFNEGSGTQAVDIITGNDGTLVNMDNTDWISSTIPFGSGFADSQTEAFGTIEFTRTGLSMDYTSTSNDTITATRIDIAPNLLPVGLEEVYDEQYWVVNRYGNDSFIANLTFTLDEDLTTADEYYPSYIKLYSRSSTSDTDWELVASAASVNAADDQATFEGITGFSQFILGKFHFNELDMKVFLEGPFNGTEMNTHLNIASELPLNQPYTNLPWNYTATESVITFSNADIVDWILVELRDAPDASTAITAPYITRQAAFIFKDGSVGAMNESSNLRFENSINEQLFVVIWHRNHLGIMSAIPLAESEGIYSYDFSVADGQAYGTGSQKDLGSGVFGMIAGDANGDGIINDTDKNPVWYTQAGIAGYLSADLNIDGQCNNQDKDDLWYPNQGYESQIHFTSSNSCPGIPTVNYEGQTYNTVQIGDQCWFKENLNVGTMINVANNQTNNSQIEKYCWGDDPANCSMYGGLYQWDEMMQYDSIEGAQGICPEGWHIPDDNEWCTLTQFIDSTVNCNGGQWSGTDVGTKMKSTAAWDPYLGTNTSGFTALPGGAFGDSSFHELESGAYFWSSSVYDPDKAWTRHLYITYENVGRSHSDRNSGFSLRCILD